MQTCAAEFDDDDDDDDDDDENTYIAHLTINCINCKFYGAVVTEQRVRRRIQISGLKLSLCNALNLTHGAAVLNVQVTRSS